VLDQWYEPAATYFKVHSRLKRGNEYWLYGLAWTSCEKIRE
jgi:hypothetical protein